MKPIFRVAPFVLLSLLGACATTAQIPSAPVAAKAKPAAPVFVISDLQGARAGAVDALLGDPALTRREGAGEYRRYMLATCALILILYPDETGAATVAHMDAAATSSGGQKPDLEACLAAG